jgi:hypothetical protein
MAVRTSRILIVLFLAAGTALWPVFGAAKQGAREEDPSGTQQETTKPQVPVMEADPSAGLLEKGYQRLYELNFDGARAEFLAYEKDRPDDPMGKAAEAASYLFEQFNAKGVLTSDFFLNDSKFLGGVDGTASQNKNATFLDANNQARYLAKERLRSNPHDIHGLLGLTIADGMESDYDALIIKKQLDGLKMMRQAEAEANTLLAVDPSQQDANVALGMSNYVIGCLPGYKRALVWFGGIHGDRTRGMAQMKSAAEHGHYLQPFAKVMLALAYEREHQIVLAHDLLADLVAEFPANPVFARELAITEKSCCKR